LGATFAEMQQFADYNTAFAELQAGSLDAVAIDIGVANYQIAGREGYVILDEYLNSEQYAVGFKKGNDALCGIINADLETMLKDGTFDEIAAEYEELGIEPEMLCLAESLGLESETEAE
jgi:polar amino acid transport system substrate-binding protein